MIVRAWWMCKYGVLQRAVYLCIERSDGVLDGVINSRSDFAMCTDRTCVGQL